MQKRKNAKTHSDENKLIFERQLTNPFWYIMQCDCDRQWYSRWETLFNQWIMFWAIDTTLNLDDFTNENKD
jgi:hypothetical protein